MLLTEKLSCESCRHLQLAPNLQVIPVHHHPIEASEQRIDLRVFLLRDETHTGYVFRPKSVAIFFVYPIQDNIIHHVDLEKESGIQPYTTLAFHPPQSHSEPC